MLSTPRLTTSVVSSLPMECQSDLTGAMSGLGLEQQPPMFVQRLMHTLRTVLLMVREVLDQCLPPRLEGDQVDGPPAPTGDPMLDIIDALLFELDGEYTAGVLGDISHV